MDLLKCYIVLLTGLVVLVRSENKTFVPTDDWKEIREGESIPAGLHVRFNLQTGKKEAKLLKDDGSKQNSLIRVENKKEDEPLDRAKIKEMLKNIKGEEVKDDKISESKFRSYDQIKQDLEFLNVKITSDIEVMSQMFTDLEEKLARKEKDDELVVTLWELENLLHQYDTAVEFAIKGGFQKLVIPCLSEENEVKVWALRLFGTAVQNNPRVQTAALEADSTKILLKLLSKETDENVRSRGIYALSCLVRGSPKAQFQFLQNSGLLVLSKIFDDLAESEKTKLQIVYLLSDILYDAQSITEKKVFGDVNWEDRLNTALLEQGWCQRIAKKFTSLEDWLSKPVNETVNSLNQETVDAVVSLLIIMSDTCISDFVVNLDLVNSVNHAIVILHDITLFDLDEGLTDSPNIQILAKLQAVRATLARSETERFDDEL